ncbi:branched-chain amino acid ABC transporter permease [Georgenia subflava]|uniref:Branched-chain amino acid ABC transporter permease n=1 Tax=Georgenia subflava TaxID=1622177 RepID=A0A6N7EE62_9MICO|nr:branched-chain amino acid ABC transporter permease [Georgenia subflava]MPV36399.1 branched-chain amino acid ABC transporter permease [Georgenia subflava]
MSTVFLLLVTGLGLGALYFLVASGLSLIYGLMGVLNFAHGVFLSLGAFVGWEVALRLGPSTWTGFLAAMLVGALAGALVAALTELLLIRPLYNRHIEQVLVTVGLGLVGIALFEGFWGTDAIIISGPAWMAGTTEILGARIPNSNFLAIAVAAALLGGLVLFLRHTRYGLIIRAGVENRSMVTALGIDVRRSFTLVFSIGGAAAGLGGVLASQYYNYVSAHLGQTLLIFAFIVTVIGGLGSIGGAAVAAMLVAIPQQLANYYLWGYGDLIAVLALAVVLLLRPTGLMGAKAA